MSTGSGASVGYSYEIQDVDIEASENIEDQAIKWEHDVDWNSSTAETTFVSEPAIIVDYQGDPDTVKFRNERAFTWRHNSRYYHRASADREFTWHFD
jgi:hypothetical protein